MCKITHQRFDCFDPRFTLRAKVERLMSIFLKNWIRIFYAFVSAIIIYVGYYYRDQILAEKAAPLDKFSYLGTIATIVGLVIAIAEILHNIKISREIKNEAAALLSNIRNFDYASFTSECQQYLDDVNYHVNLESYAIALKSFQHFRVTYSKFSFEIKECEKINSILNITESALHAGVQSNARAPLEKKQRRLITDNILKAKDILQNEASQKKESHVSA